MLKYEGRLTRTRGYQAAGAEVWLLFLLTLQPFSVPRHLQFSSTEADVCSAVLISTSGTLERERRMQLKASPFSLFLCLFFFSYCEFSNDIFAD